MLRSHGLAAAFAGGPANPNDPADLPRFRSQAYWLGKCSEVVYPPAPGGESPSENDHEDENEKDRQAEAANQAYRKLRPWWKVFAKKTAEVEQAQEKWHQAVAAWAAIAEKRIAKEVGEFWDPGGETPPEELEVQFISCVGTQYFVAKDRNIIIVCFRGTEPKKRWDIFSDLLSVQCDDAEIHHGKIHLGFWTALDHVWGDVGTPSTGKLLPELLRMDPIPENRQTVWFTGHSLGGALAALAADRLLVTKILSEENVGGVFTFGQPRIGDRKFAEGYPLGDRHFRFINNNDIVPRIPPKSLRFVSSIFGMFFNRASQPEASQPEARKSQGSMNFSDVGQVIFANRSGDFKLLKPGSFQWKFQLFQGRSVSRFMAPFKSSGIVNRFFPGLTDHSMTKYNFGLDRLDTSSGEEVPREADQ